MRKPLSRSQCICLTLLWMGLCYIVLVQAERVDGPVIVSLLMSGALVFIPLYKSFNKNK